jgi:hypothetical protein
MYGTLSAVIDKCSTETICIMVISRSFILSLVAAVSALSGCVGVSTNNTVPTPSVVIEAQSWRQHTVKFPQISVYDLEGVKHNFPEEFEGKTTLVLIAFKHEQQAKLDPWLKATTPLVDTTPNFSVIEMPTIERSSAPFRAMVNNGMRSGIGSEGARRRTMTLYVNKREFLDTVGIQDESKVYALLVNHTGEVVWRFDGDYTAEALTDLVAQLS